MDLLHFLTDHAASVSGMVGAGISGLAAWLLSLRNISATVERTRIAMSVDAAKAEAVERAAFRSALVAEVAQMRHLIKECETDKDTLRQRLSATEAQILILKASNEIMERWVAFFNERGHSLDQVPNMGPSAKNTA